MKNKEQKKIIINKPDKPEHNQDALEVFSKVDVSSGKPYFCFFKKNDGEAHILTNIANKKNLYII